MDDLLELMIEQDASDLHLHVNQAPTLRLHGKMVPVEGEKLTPKDTSSLPKKEKKDPLSSLTQFKRSMSCLKLYL